MELSESLVRIVPISLLEEGEKSSGSMLMRLGWVGQREGRPSMN